MNKLAIAKTVINVAAGLGVSKVTSDIINQNTTTETTEDKIKVMIGAMVIGSMVVDRTSDHVNSTIDKIVKNWQDRNNTTETAA
jgi:hypothetical protein